MNKHLFHQLIATFCLLLCSPALLWSATVQPAWSKKAFKSVFTLQTFDAGGSLIASSHGFFVGKMGEAVSNLSAFKGAARATIIDSQGKEYGVSMILGFNDLYDVVRFRVDTKQSIPLTVSATHPTEGETLWLLPYRLKKAALCVEGQLEKSEPVADRYAYYTLSMSTPDHALSLPLLNASGEVVGLCQPSSSSADANRCYAIGADYAASLKMTGLSLNHEVLRTIGIKKDLPDELDQAVLTLYIAGTGLDSARLGSYRQLVDDFVSKFPTAPDGYISRAQIALADRDYAQAKSNMDEALKVATKKDDVHYSYARMMLQKEMTDSATPFEPWSLDAAAAEAEEAYKVNPLPAYRQLEGQIRFTQKQYDEALRLYLSAVGKGNIDAELYTNAAQCKQAQNDTTAYLALLDSAVNTFSKPYLKAAAPYLLTRAYAMLSAGRFRNAFTDLNEYEQLMPTEVNDRFYYVRSQAAVGGRLFQQALNDLDKAIGKTPSNTLYYSEKASIEVRVGLYAQAMETARKCIAADPDQSDGYLFLGLALCLSGQQAEGCKQLEKARDLGDNQAEALIRKYGGK